PDRSGGIILVKRSMEVNVQVLAGPAIDLIGGERLQCRYRLPDYGPRSGLQSPHGMMRQGFDLEMEGRHVGVEAGADEVVRVGAGFGAKLGRAGEEALYPTHGLQKSGDTKVGEGDGHDPS